MKPDELDLNFSTAELVIIETKARDTFSLVNVDTGTTLRRDVKFLKHASSQHIGNDIDVDISAETGGVYWPFSEKKWPYQKYQAL